MTLIWYIINIIKKAYKNQAEKLVRLFAENVKRFAGEMPEEILNAGPRLED